MKRRDPLIALSRKLRSTAEFTEPERRILSRILLAAGCFDAATVRYLVYENREGFRFTVEKRLVARFIKHAARLEHAIGELDSLEPRRRHGMLAGNASTKGDCAS